MSKPHRTRPTVRGTRRNQYGPAGTTTFYSHPVSCSPSMEERAVKLSPTQSVFRHDPLCYDFMIAALRNANYNIYWNNVRYSHWNHVYASLKEQDQSTIKSSLFLQQPLLVATARVGVVRARPRAGATILVVRVDDADNRTISATN